MVSGTKSGSILLFHNDLENTTEALPDLLTQLKDKGFSFVKVSDLIFSENYTINAQGEQVAEQKTGLEITPENVDEVMAQYSEELAAMGYTEEQLAMAAAAVKGGAEIPEEVQAVIANLTTASDSTPDSTGEADVPDLTDESDSGNIEVEDAVSKPSK